MLIREETKSMKLFKIFAIFSLFNLIPIITFAANSQSLFINVINTSGQALTFTQFIPSGPEELLTTPQKVLRPGESDTIEIGVATSQELLGIMGELDYTNAKNQPVELQFLDPKKTYQGGYADFTSSCSLIANIGKEIQTSPDSNLFWKQYTYELVQPWFK